MNIKKHLLLLLALIPTLASAQFVRHTQKCGEVKAESGTTCEFRVTEDMDIPSGRWTGHVAIMNISSRMEAGGGNVLYEELTPLIQTLRYAKDNPPASGDDGVTKVVFRAEDYLEFSCEPGYGSHPGAFIDISPAKPGPGIAARIPWENLDALISMLEKCKAVMDPHCGK